MEPAVKLKIFKILSTGLFENFYFATYVFIMIQISQHNAIFDQA